MRGALLALRRMSAQCYGIEGYAKAANFANTPAFILTRVCGGE